MSTSTSLILNPKLSSGRGGMLDRLRLGRPVAPAKRDEIRRLSQPRSLSTTLSAMSPAEILGALSSEQRRDLTDRFRREAAARAAKVAAKKAAEQRARAEAARAAARKAAAVRIEQAQRQAEERERRAAAASAVWDRAIAANFPQPKGR